MFGQIATFLADTVVTFLVFLLLARFYFQWLRVPFRNPFGEFLIATTNWAVKPVRRVVPGLVGLDLASFLLAWIFQGLGLWVQASIKGLEPGILALALVALVDLLRYSLYLLVIAVLAQALLSWINPYTSAAPVLDALCRPFLRPLRRYIPPAGRFDLTPLVLLILIQVVLIMVAHLRPMAAAV